MLTDQVTPVREVAKGAPAELAAIAGTCLQRNPRDRYQSVEQLAEDVATFQSGGLVSAYTYNTGRIIARWTGASWLFCPAGHSFEGDIAAGQGLMGISQGFIYAGAGAVIASQAQVRDDATCKLMVTFYRNWWNEGMSKAEALRAAKQVLARSEEHSNPRYWAPFVLYGAG
ncbi:CHAT domain-containing protein [bacterium]|nr:CHAT domain-containing protein [bacterium]